MSLIEPHASWHALEARAKAEPDPRVRTLLTTVRDHTEHEIRGDLDALMATLTAEPVYHFWNPAGSFALEGRAAIAGSAVKPGDLFLSRAQLITVWPGDSAGKLVGEDIHFGEDALATAGRITRADLPATHRLAQ